jgi:putative peptide zinc metalloprotease protein
MTTLADGSSLGDSQPAGPESGTPAIAGVPTRADGVQLLGEQPGSGYRVPPALVQRSDGQVLQLTPLLYAVLSAADGRRTPDEIADAVSAAVGRDVRGEDIEVLVAKQLRPLGLLTRADGAQPDVRKANPLLALRFRYVVSNPERTRRITAPFAALFHPVLVVLATVAFAVVAYWVLFHKGLASAAHEAFADPGMLLAVFAITVVSAGFHEFGHAAALRRGGGTPGAMGAGLYLVWPAFYTDVTDSYRLDRRSRLRTDLGGLYFNALVALAMFGVWAAVRWDGLLLVIATQILQMIRQLPPMLRFDGYHLLADITGIPDLFHRIKPTLKGLVPTKWRSPEARMLKPWARAVVSFWVLLVVPLMLLTALVTILTLPRILASAANSFATQWTLLSAYRHDGNWTGVGAKVLALIAVLIPVFGVSYIVSRMVKQLVSSTLRRTKGKPVKRAGAAAVGAALVAALVWVWWPHGNYRVIQPGERGVLQQVLIPSAVTQAIGHAPATPLSAAAAPLGTADRTAGSRALHDGQRATAHTVWPAGAPRPTAGHPTLVMVLSPQDPGKPTWVFPFNRPAPPGPGDNQAMAVATRDHSTVYDVAFALVYADQNTVLNKNEAYAFASCKQCTAVAVAFQVVLVVGDAHVVAPQNISAAVNYNCIRCVTAALAIQLDVSIPSQPDASTAAALQALWAKIRAFGDHLRGLTFSQIHDKLVAYEEQILAIVKPFARSTASPTIGASPPGGTSSSAGAGEPGAGSTAPASSSAAASSPAVPESSSSAVSPSTAESSSAAQSSDTDTSAAAPGGTSSPAASSSAP